MWSRAGSALTPSLVTGWPFTMTRPASIISSALRRLAMPARERIFCKRSSLAGGRGVKAVSGPASSVSASSVSTSSGSASAGMALAAGDGFGFAGIALGAGDGFGFAAFLYLLMPLLFAGAGFSFGGSGAAPSDCACTGSGRISWALSEASSRRSALRRRLCRRWDLAPA